MFVYTIELWKTKQFLNIYWKLWTVTALIIR